MEKPSKGIKARIYHNSIPIVTGQVGYLGTRGMFIKTEPHGYPLNVPVFKELNMEIIGLDDEKYLQLPAMITQRFQNGLGLTFYDLQNLDADVLCELSKILDDLPCYSTPMKK